MAASKKKKKSFKESLTTNQKIGLTIAMIPLGIVVVLSSIYYQASFLSIILKSYKGSKWLERALPSSDKIPYFDRTNAPPVPSTLNNESLSEMMDKPKQEAPPPPPPAPKFNKKENNAKEFLDPTKWGAPYSLQKNANFIMNGWGQYFITFMQTVRSLLKVFLEFVNDTFYKDGNKTPETLIEKVTDFAKFVCVIPIANLITFSGLVLTAFPISLWASFTNQTLMMFPLLGFSICLLIFGALMGGYFWPWGFLSIFLTAFIVYPSVNKFANFNIYNERYKWIWAMLLYLFWFVSIGYLWDFQQDLITGFSITAVILFMGMVGIKMFPM